MGGDAWTYLVAIQFCHGEYELIVFATQRGRAHHSQQIMAETISLAMF
jgi:hypothetical protein